MAYKFQVGPARLSGALHQEGTLLADDKLTVAGGGASITGAVAMNSTLDVAGDISGAANLSAGGALDIAGTGDIADTLTLSKASGDGLVVTATAKFNGNVQLGNASGDLIQPLGVFTNDLMPQNQTKNIGSSTVHWKELHVITASVDKVEATSLSGALINPLDSLSGSGLVAFSYDNSAAVSIEVNGATSLNDNEVLKWSNDAFVASSMSDDGTTVSVVANLSASGDLDVAGIATFGDVISASAGAEMGSIMPATGTDDLGAISDEWQAVYAQNIYASTALSGAQLQGVLEFSASARSDGGLVFDFDYNNAQDSQVALKNYSALSDTRIMRWNNTADQLEDSIMRDDGSTVVVSGALSASGQLDIDGPSNLDGAVAMGSTLDVAGIITASAGAEFRSTISVLGAANFEGDVYLGAGGDDVVYLDSGLQFSGSIIPDASSSYDIGSDPSAGGRAYANAYIDSIYATNIYGNIAFDIQRATANGTAFADETELYICGGAMTALTLPVVGASTDGKVVRVKRDDTCTGNVTISPGAGSSFDDGSPIILEEKGAALTCVYYHAQTKWYII